MTCENSRSGAPRITDAGVKQLTAFPNLTTLVLENTEVTDAGLEVLEKLPKLKSLNLRRSIYMTDAGLGHVKKLPNLQYLSLLYNNITDAGLAELKDMKKLKPVGPSRLHANRRCRFGPNRGTDEPQKPETPQHDHRRGRGPPRKARQLTELSIEDAADHR